MASTCIASTTVDWWVRSTKTDVFRTFSRLLINLCPLVHHPCSDPFSEWEQAAHGCTGGAENENGLLEDIFITVLTLQTGGVPLPC